MNDMKDKPTVKPNVIAVAALFLLVELLIIAAVIFF